MKLQIESPELDLEYLMSLPGFTLRYYPATPENSDELNSFYVGQLAYSKTDERKKILRQGMGVMRYSNGRQYEGEWEDDRRNGRGFERYSNNNSYFGSFKDGKAHGKGVYKWINGEVYDGEWECGLKHGHGVWTSSDGCDSYIGEWKHSKAEGYGIH